MVRAFGLIRIFLPCSLTACIGRQLVSFTVHPEQKLRRYDGQLDIVSRRKGDDCLQCAIVVYFCAQLTIAVDQLARYFETLERLQGARRVRFALKISFVQKGNDGVSGKYCRLAVIGR